jgi:hypothetical protein
VAEESLRKTEAAGKQTLVALLASAERDATTRAKLDKLVDAQFTETPLQDVFDYLADSQKVQFFVKHRSLSEQGISTDTPIKMNLRQVPASKILHLILEELGLDYSIQEGVVIISSPDSLENQDQLIVKVYNLHNWLDVAPQPKEVERLIQVITNTVYPQSWDAMGGTGSIESFVSPKPRGQQKNGGVGPAATDSKEAVSPPASSVESSETDSPTASGNFQGMIVVCQSTKVHERISNLLDQLRLALKQKGEQ